MFPTRYVLLMATMFGLTAAMGSLPTPAAAAEISSKRYQELLAAGKYSDALDVAQRLEELARLKVGTRHPRYGSALGLQASILNVLNRHAEAEAMYKRALKIFETYKGAQPILSAEILNNLGILHREQGRYAEAEPLLKRALAIYEKTKGVDQGQMAGTVDNLGIVALDRGRAAEAEQLFKRALAIREQAFGKNDPAVARTLNNLAGVYREQGRYADTEATFKRALAIVEQALGANHPHVAMPLNNLALVFSYQGRYREAEALAKRALAIRERVFGPHHADVAASLDLIAIAAWGLGRPGEAEELHTRALAIRERALGATHPDVAQTLINLFLVYDDQGRYAEAERAAKRALAIREQAYGANHPYTAVAANHLGVAYWRLGRNTDAEPLWKRALAVREQTLGPSHPDVAETLINLANIYSADARRPGEAEALYQRVLRIREETFGAHHPDVATTLNNMAMHATRGGDLKAALGWSRKATAAVLAHTLTGVQEAQRDGSGALLQHRIVRFRLNLALLTAAATAGIEPRSVLAEEAFAVAQWASQSTAAAALQQIAVRFRAASGPLTTLVREHQDLGALRHERDKALVGALGVQQGRNDAVIASLRKQVADLDAKLAAIATRLATEFPDYAALASSKPLNPARVQQLLGRDEALVFWFAGEAESYVFAMTQVGFAWRIIPFGAEALAQHVKAFRRGLDIDALHPGPEPAGTAELFDLGRASELYSVLFSPVEPLIKDKPHLFVVPTGPLTALPFHLLVTAEQTGAPPTRGNLTPYRDAAWLLRRHAVTVLPSVTSLEGLRALARQERARRTMIGFGDPLFDPEQNVAEAGAALPAAPRALAARGYADYWKGAEVDRSELARALPPLPETAEELKAIATKLGVPAVDIHLRAAASETNVKRLRLGDYRIIYFATHGLVAGDIKGIGEPALALTLPKQPTELDDGLLTASEVAQLKLNADWVVLSACNTIAGDKPGAEALSGLARAFFYAGARALLVSHWAVDSNAAARLATSTFDILTAEPSIGRSEALRHAMLAYLEDRSHGWNAYPALWGAFSLIGEGVRDSP